MHVPSTESEQSGKYMCATGINYASVSTTFQLDFGCSDLLVVVLFFSLYFIVIITCGQSQ